jgi:hypothetical protein
MGRVKPVKELVIIGLTVLAVVLLSYQSSDYFSRSIMDMLLGVTADDPNDDPTPDFQENQPIGNYADIWDKIDKVHMEGGSESDGKSIFFSGTSHSDIESWARLSYEYRDTEDSGSDIKIKYRINVGKYVGYLEDHSTKTQYIFVVFLKSDDPSKNGRVITCFPCESNYP